MWVLVHGRLLYDDGDTVGIRHGTALARAVYGELGDWSRLDIMVTTALGGEPPESRETIEWKRAEQARIKEIRAKRAAKKSSGSLR